MEQETQQSKSKGASAGSFQEEFKALPLDQKFSNLLQMEVATLSEAMKYVADLSMKVLEQVGDAISDFGAKVETEAKNATAANEPASSEATKSSAEPKRKNAPKRKPAAPKA